MFETKFGAVILTFDGSVVDIKRRVQSKNVLCKLFGQTDLCSHQNIYIF